MRVSIELSRRHAARLRGLSFEKSTAYFIELIAKFLCDQKRVNCRIQFGNYRKYAQKNLV